MRSSFRALEGVVISWPNLIAMQGHCEICGTEIWVRMCCNGYMCGCMGQPIDPPACSNDCYDKLIEKYKFRQSETVIKQQSIDIK